MLIKGVQPLSLIDYPEKLSAIVFLFGCNFRCPYCQNPGLVDENREQRPTISEENFFSFLEKRKGLLEGVVVTGGEPCLNSDLPVFLKKIKDMGFLVKLDSNGSQPEMLKRVASEKLVDYFAMDVKAPLAKYAQVVNASVDVEKIHESIEFIKNSGVPHEFRTTVVPSLLDETDLMEIGGLIQGADSFYLQQFRPDVTLDVEFEKTTPFRREFLLEMQEKLRPFAKKVGVRGL